MIICLDRALYFHDSIYAPVIFLLSPYTFKRCHLWSVLYFALNLNKLTFWLINLTWIQETPRTITSIILHALSLFTLFTFLVTLVKVKVFRHQQRWTDLDDQPPRYRTVQFNAMQCNANKLTRPYGHTL